MPAPVSQRPAPGRRSRPCLTGAAQASIPSSSSCTNFSVFILFFFLSFFLLAASFIFITFIPVQVFPLSSSCILCAPRCSRAAPCTTAGSVPAGRQSFYACCQVLQPSGQPHCAVSSSSLRHRPSHGPDPIPTRSSARLWWEVCWEGAGPGQGAGCCCCPSAPRTPWQRRALAPIALHISPIQVTSCTYASANVC